MAGTLFNFPFDEELFLNLWNSEPDPTLNAFLDSGVLGSNPTLRNLISTGSNTYSLPYYKDLTDNIQNYDGNTDIEPVETVAGYQTGIVYGRAMSYSYRNFVADFNNGADPMANIVARFAKKRNNDRQKTLLGITNAIFSNAGDTAFSVHTTDIATKTASVSDANLISATTANDAMQKALGDKKGDLAVIAVHSAVAKRLENLQLLEFRKYTDLLGITRTLTIADYNGLTVIVDDGLPVADSSSASGAKEYTSYLYAAGAIWYEQAPLKDNLPVEPIRDGLKNGGMDILVGRWRETIHPDGFSYDLSNDGISNKVSPTLADLSLAAAWSRKFDPKNIKIARIITNG